MHNRRASGRWYCRVCWDTGIYTISIKINVLDKWGYLQVWCTWHWNKCLFSGCMHHAQVILDRFASVTLQDWCDTEMQTVVKGAHSSRYWRQTTIRRQRLHKTTAWNKKKNLPTSGKTGGTIGGGKMLQIAWKMKNETRKLKGTCPGKKITARCKSSCYGVWQPLRREGKTILPFALLIPVNGKAQRQEMLSQIKAVSTFSSLSLWACSHTLGQKWAVEVWVPFTVLIKIKYNKNPLQTAHIALPKLPWQYFSTVVNKCLTFKSVALNRCPRSWAYKRWIHKKPPLFLSQKKYISRRRWVTLYSARSYLEEIQKITWEPKQEFEWQVVKTWWG